MSRSPGSWVSGLSLTALLFAGRPRAKGELSKIASAAREWRRSTGADPQGPGDDRRPCTGSTFLAGFIGHQLSLAEEADHPAVQWAGDCPWQPKRWRSRHSSTILRRDGWQRPTPPGLKGPTSPPPQCRWVTPLLVPPPLLVGMAEMEENALSSTARRFATIAGSLLLPPSL